MKLSQFVFLKLGVGDGSASGEICVEDTDDGEVICA